MRARILIVVALTLLLAPAAGAVDWHINSQTIGQGYQLITSSGDVLKRSRLNQFLGLDVLDLGGDKTNRFSIVTSLRFDSDFGITGVEAKNIEQLKNNNLSIMYLYFQMQNVSGFDLRVGRQLLMDDLDFTMLDGARLVYHTPIHLGIEVVGGLEVKNNGALGVISSTQLELDGAGGYDDNKDEELGIVIGAALFLDNLRAHHGKLAYRRVMTADGDLDSERLSLNYHVRVLPQLHLSAAAAWDFTIMDLSDIRAELRAPKLGDIVDIELAYWRLVPTFEGSSIFNVFSVEPLNDIDLRTRFHIARGISVYVGGYARLFGNDPDGDDLLKESDAIFKDFGVRAGGRVKLGMSGWVGLDASYQAGYGDMTVIDASGGYGFLDNDLKLDARLTTVVFDDLLQADLEATSFGVALGISYEIESMAKFHLISEVNTNRIETLQFRVFGLVDLDFWL